MKLNIGFNVCRVCKTSSCSKSLFDESNLVEKFCYLTGLNAAPDDGLPSKLCDKCIARLKVADDFKKESNIADTHFRQFIQKVNEQFQELTVIKNKSTKDSDLEQFLDSTSSSTKKDQESVFQSTSSFINGVQLRPQSTVKEIKLQKCFEEKNKPHQPSIKIQNEQIYVESYELDDIEETLEEYQTVVEEPQVVYISLDEKKEYPIIDKPSNTQTEEKNNEKEKINHFNNETNLKSIIVKEETFPRVSETNHYCQKCEKQFSTKTNLLRHIATHDGKRPYVCSICQKRFSQNSSLKQHTLIHTGERPYKCNVCSRSFTQAKSLTFHMRRHTGKTQFSVTCKAF
uniref:CSON011307 protein n=1 Tax=Culicoides sonorensis TaxID=179676 RepID=A0A336LR47_CULSO